MFRWRLSINNLKGSVWRKWDLHIHTPSSYDYFNKGITNQEIIDKLIDADISVVAITDHHVIDVERILELQKLAADKITILPGIELRSEYGGRESVHYIGIFPEDCDINDIWLKLQVKLKLTPLDLKGKSNEKIYTEFRHAANVIHECGGIVTIHAGTKSNSIENISNIESFKQAFKTDIVINSIDIFEIGKPNDEIDYRNIVFPEIGKTLPIILCSDNHNIKEYNGKKYCWIKSSPTFKGLCHTLFESKDRIYIGIKPPKMNIVDINKTKYIKSLLISKNFDSKLQEDWFNDEIQFNHDLVAIIGNKGNGKSALVDIIGLLGETKHYKEFSFLNTNKFRDKRNNKAKHFKAILTWESGQIVSKSLDENPDGNSVETIKYVPQNFLEKICNEVSDGEENSFDKELKEVIFSHVDVSERLGKDSLDALLAFKTNEIYSTISILKEDLHNINEEIIALEEKTTEEYKKGLESNLQIKINEFETHESSKPIDPKSLDNEKLKVEMLKILEEINKLKLEKECIVNQIKIQEELRTDINTKISFLERITTKTTNFKKLYDKYRIDCSQDLIYIGLKFEDLVAFNVNYEMLEKKGKDLNDMKKNIENILDINNKDSLINNKILIESKIKDLETKLDEPNKINEEYLKLLELWNEKKKIIVGEETIPGTLNFFKKQYDNMAIIPQELDLLYGKRIDKTIEIYKEIQLLTAVYQKLYLPVQNFVEQHKLKENFKLNFDVSIININFKNIFLNKINHNTTGSFCGNESAENITKDILEKYNFNKEDDLKLFINEVIEHLRNDKRNGRNTKNNNLNNQLKKDVTLCSLYDFIFSLEYLKPKYILKLDDKELHQLSPGQKGTLLLIFYLLIDKSDIPLVLDQPEENLDSETIFNILVQCIKEAKQKRQIIIVTHSPNLAVVTDAEQIIYASYDKSKNNRIRYLCGAIECPEFNQHVVDILEGTWPAFENRDLKYFSSRK